VRHFWRKKRMRRVPEMGELPLTPLIDTAFTLLIIFMVTAPMMQNSIKVALPKTKSAASAADTVERLIVTIDAKGQLFVGDHKMANLLALVKYLQDKIALTIDKTVLIKADKSLIYDQVIQVIDAISGVEGVQSVALAQELAAKGA
jgi:biopolymer transport protein ExbD